MDKTKELEAHLDMLLELRSREQCLNELYGFAVEQLGRYRGKLKNDPPADLFK